eukprot:RCo054499
MTPAKFGLVYSFFPMSLLLRVRHMRAKDQEPPAATSSFQFSSPHSPGVTVRSALLLSCAAYYFNLAPGELPRSGLSLQWLAGSPPSKLFSSSFSSFRMDASP